MDEKKKILFSRGFKYARKGENNIQMSLRDTGCNSQKWVSLEQDGVKFRSNCVELSGFTSRE